VFFASHLIGFRALKELTIFLHSLDTKEIKYDDRLSTEGYYITFGKKNFRKSSVRCNKCSKSYFIVMVG
jgi:hypothetical protein